MAEDELIGRLCIRYRLNAALTHFGGHIGYEIRPSRLGQGFGHRALALGITKAREKGLADLLLTCDDGNAASAGIVERAGGVLENVIPHSMEPGRLARRYWIRTDGRRVPA